MVLAIAILLCVSWCGGWFLDLFHNIATAELTCGQSGQTDGSGCLAGKQRRGCETNWAHGDLLCRGTLAAENEPGTYRETY
jgi:hypothetical protein